MDFNTLRKEYSKFIYNDYKITEDNEKIYVEYDFEIEGLSKFNPRIEILKKKFKVKDINSASIKNIVFNLGMVEAISYFKATCSKRFIIKCGFLNDEQKKWFRKLFFLGLGEFRYVNNINTKEEDFVEFVCEGKGLQLEEDLNTFDGIIICVIPVDANAFVPIVVNDSGNVIVVSWPHPLNALSPILFILVGNSIVVNDVAPLNAFDPIFVVDEIITFSILFICDCHSGWFVSVKSVIDPSFIDNNLDVWL